MRELFKAAAAGRTVLAPNSELAAALFAAVERMHLDAGHDLWPTPRILDFSSWLSERYAQRQLREAGLPRALTDLEERELWRDVVLDSPAGDGLLEPSGAARAARRARRVMLEHGIPFERLAREASEEAAVLLEWNRAFELRCRELRCMPADRLLETATGEDALLWIESPSWRPTSARWLARHGAPLAAPAPAPAAAPTPGSGARGAAMACVRASSPAAELAAIAEWTRRNTLDHPEFRAWICIPDLPARRAAVLDAFDAALAPERFSLTETESPAPYAAAGGTPLAGFAPVRAALAVLAVSVGVVPCQQFSALLRLPELQGSAAEAVASARVDMALRTQGPHAAHLHEWLRLAEVAARASPAAPVAALQRLTGVQRILEGCRGEQRMSRWVSVWVEAFEAGPWLLRGRWSSVEFQAAERFRKLLAALAIGDAAFGLRSAASAARVLERAARETAFQPQTGVPPVWISGQVIDPWLHYDGLWIAGCSEERWPPSLDPVPLVPIGLQREYGVVAASTELQLRFALDLQRRWSLRAASSVFSCADATDGTPASASPLVSTAPAVPLAVTITQPHWHALARAASALEQLRDEQAPVFGSDERTRGVATLRDQSLCCFRGFARTRLSAGGLELPEPGFSQRERGEMVHRALEEIWGRLGGSEGLSRYAPEALNAWVAQCAARAIALQCARRDPGERWRRREYARLPGLLHKWLRTELQRAPFVVEHLEQGAQTVRFAGLAFNVRIDRVDRLLSGGRVLLDYKTGSVAADWRGERPDNPQLPVYALLQPAELVAVAYARVNASECCFIAESERAEVFRPEAKPTRLEGLPDFASLIATWARRIEALAAGVAAGDAVVAPSATACASCDLQPLCRVTASLEQGEEEGEDGEGHGRARRGGAGADD